MEKLLMENLSQVVKDDLDYIFIGNKFKTVSASFYDDYVNELGITGTLDSMSDVSSYVEVDTHAGKFKFLPHTIVKTKGLTDVSEYLYEQKARDLSPSSFLVLNYLPEQVTTVSKLRVTSRTDIKYTRIFTLLKELKLPSWFLLDSLIKGVPEYEEYNNILDDYLSKNNITIQDLRKNIIESNTNYLPLHLNIGKWYLNLILLFLSGSFRVTPYSVELLFNSYNDKYLPDIIEFLNKYGIYYVQENSKLSCYSSFICSLFQSSFDSLSYLVSLNDTNTKYMLQELDSYFSFSSSIVNLLNLQRFLLFNKILSKIDYNSLSIVRDYYFVVDSMFFIPILSVDLRKNVSSKCLNIKSFNNDYSF